MSWYADVNSYPLEIVYIIFEIEPRNNVIVLNFSATQYLRCMLRRKRTVGVKLSATADIVVNHNLEQPQAREEGQGAYQLFGSRVGCERRAGEARRRRQDRVGDSLRSLPQACSRCL